MSRTVTHTGVLIGGPRDHVRMAVSLEVRRRGVFEVPEYPYVPVMTLDAESLGDLAVGRIHTYYLEEMVFGSDAITFWRHSETTAIDALISALEHYAAKPKPCKRCGYKECPDD